MHYDVSVISRILKIFDVNLCACLFVFFFILSESSALLPI